MKSTIPTATLVFAEKPRRAVKGSRRCGLKIPVSSKSSKSTVMSLHEREIVAYHEADHAIVASLLPGVDPVHKISIVQRGFEALGHTLQLPAEEHYLVTLNQLAVLLGGRSAEEIIFQEISTGAHNDLQRATDLARSMVAEYGMSESLGPALKGRTRQRFLEVLGVEPEPFADETARQIDAEIK